MEPRYFVRDMELEDVAELTHFASLILNVSQCALMFMGAWLRVNRQAVLEDPEGPGLLLSATIKDTMEFIDEFIPWWIEKNNLKTKELKHSDFAPNSSKGQ